MLAGSIHCTTSSPFPASPPARWRRSCEGPGRVFRHPGQGGALGGALHRGGQGDHEPALRQLPSGGHRPMQGDDGHPHQPLVVRGDGDIGAVGMRCFTCHGEKNYDPAHVPGNPQWHLAPDRNGLGEKIARPDLRADQGPGAQWRQGHGRADRAHGQDSLVGWGWDPGAGRDPVPGTQKQFGALIKAWADTGAACPKGSFASTLHLVARGATSPGTIYSP